MLSASAYDEVALQPTNFALGKTAKVNIVLNMDTYVDEMQNIMFDIVLPTGWAISTGATSITSNTDRTVGLVWDADFEEWVESSDFSYSIQKQASTEGVVYRFLAKSDDMHPLKGQTGVLCSITLKAPNTEGYYPVKIVGAYATKDAVDANNLLFEDASTYMIVGTPSEASLSLEGQIPSFVNTALATEAAVKTLNLSAVTAVNGTFTYVDGREVIAPATSVTADLKYTHAAGKYYSVKAPFAYTPSTDVYTFNGVSGEYAKFDKATEVAANTPVLVEGALDITATAPIAAVAPEVKNDVYYVQGETIYHGKNITVKPMRGVWEGIAGASNLRIAIDGTLTDINAAEINAQAVSSFDLQGRQVANAKNGVYVVNGKKQFVK